MGDVYEVSHARMAGRYALKLLARQETGQVEALHRFQREATIVSSLRHPHIVQVIDFDQTAEGRPYLVMELLEGEDLHAHMRRLGPMPLPRVVAVVKQIASALAAAHGRGVVHRDLKPENVLLVNIEGQEGDYVKIVDFGVSKVKSASLRLTKGGTMMGTPHYMAPEQAQGASDVDERADQFALAAIAYELLCGEIAFAGDDVAAVVYQVVFGEPPRLADAGGLAGAAVDAVLKKALSKAPAGRFGSIAEFAKSLEEAARGTQGSRAGASWPKLAPVTVASAQPRPAAATVSGSGPSRGGSARGKIVIVVLLTAVAGSTLWVTMFRDREPAPASVNRAKAPSPRPVEVPVVDSAPLPVEKTEVVPVEEPPATPAPAKPARRRRPASSGGEPLYNDL